MDYDPQNKIYIQTFIHINKYINKWGEGKALFYNGIPISIEEKRETKIIRQTALNNYFMPELSMNAKISEIMRNWIFSKPENTSPQDTY